MKSKEQRAKSKKTITNLLLFIVFESCFLLRTLANNCYLFPKPSSIPLFHLPSPLLGFSIKLASYLLYILPIKSSFLFVSLEIGDHFHLVHSSEGQKLFLKLVPSNKNQGVKESRNQGIKDG